MGILDSINKKKKEKNNLDASKLIITQLNEDELKYLISLISRSDFKGSDIHILFNVTVKLQNQFVKITKDKDKDKNK
tara:strand:+ start:109 stop:339 length:231 start_codon:yes stop_codon:yes gene_type:complete